MKENIINLSKLFLKEDINNFNLIKEDNKTINKKSPLFWILIVLFMGIIWISNELIDYFVRIGKPEIFLNLYFLFIEIIMLIQTIILCTNVLYYSKDIDNILPLPFKGIEILIAKCNVILTFLYGTEIVFLLIPMIMYGIYIKIGILFYINLIIILAIFPIFSITLVGMISMLLMRILKVFKNKEIIQFIITTVLIFGLMFLMNNVLDRIFVKQDKTINESNAIQQEILDKVNDRIINANSYFLIVNPSTNILQNNNVILNYFKLISINILAFCAFILLGNKLYLKQLLKNKLYKKKRKKIKRNIGKIIKKDNAFNSYLKKEFKLLFKNIQFFIQSIYPIILMTIMVCSLIITLMPLAIEFLKREEYKEMMESLKFDFEAICLILGLLQIVGLFNYASITAFSREGKNAFFIKTIPISLYKQYVIKNIPQVFINTICSVFILAVIKYEIPSIEMKYIVIMFVLSFLLFLINSFILSLIDLLNPKLNWDAEYEILQNNKNKLIQYVLIIFNIIFLYYFNKLFTGKNLKFSIIIFGSILIFILIILNFVINKFKNKLFKKIN